MNSVVLVHKIIGFAIVAGFAVLWIFGLVARVMKKADAGKAFWILVSVMQVVSAVQAVIGVGMLIGGRLALEVLHYAYGIFPIFAFVGAHAYARNMRADQRPYPYLPFAFVGFFSMGLTMRALMTGLGM